MVTRTDLEGHVEGQLAGISVALNDQLGTLSRKVVAAVRAEVDFYAETTVISNTDLVDNCTSSLRLIFSGLRHRMSFDTAPAIKAGDARAIAGVPLPVVTRAYRVAFHHVWLAIDELAENDPRLSRPALLRTAQRIWEAQDAYTDAMTASYRWRTTQQVIRTETVRADLITRLFEGRVSDDHSLWEIADLLQLPTRGPYVAVAAVYPRIGEAALPGIDHKLRSLDIHSAWRLLPDQQVGIVHAASDALRHAMLDLLRRLSRDRVGVSAPFDNLADTPAALRYARVALNGRRVGTNVTAFDDSMLGIAAVTEPEMNVRLSEMVLGALHHLSPNDRAVLTTTFGAWVNRKGSVSSAATDLFCHPNTVRSRLRRIEELCDRSLSAPHDLAELCLAFEIDARLSATNQASGETPPSDPFGIRGP